MRWGAFGFNPNEKETYSGYYDEKLGGSRALGPTQDPLAELINGVKKTPMITLKIDNDWKITGEETIICQCDDSGCGDKRGFEGEVEGHIEDCGCSHCHRELGKL